MATAVGDTFLASDFSAIFAKLEATRQKHYAVYQKASMSTAYATDIPIQGALGKQEIYGNESTLNTILGDIKNLAESPNIDYTSVIAGLNIPNIGDVLSYNTHYANLVAKVDAIANICAYQSNYTSEASQGNYSNYTSTASQGNYTNNYTSAASQTNYSSNDGNYTSDAQNGDYSNYTSTSSQGNYSNYTLSTQQGNYAQYSDTSQDCSSNYTSTSSQGNYSNYTLSTQQGNYAQYSDGTQDLA